MQISDWLGQSGGVATQDCELIVFPDTHTHSGAEMVHSCRTHQNGT